MEVVLIAYGCALGLTVGGGRGKEGLGGGGGDARVVLAFPLADDVDNEDEETKDDFLDRLSPKLWLSLVGLALRLEEPAVGNVVLGTW